MRQELVKKIIELTGVKVDDVSVEVSFHNQATGDLLTQARDLGWFADEHQGAAWFTSDIPLGGATAIYLDEGEEEIVNGEP